ncbi:hypothetical protein BGY98DRAFT_1091621 [Russula aff. rugulosa BPL654]|nr:hypothetical protein BGY98DRAFT_1091621 [Russula aff. rugulosa BPL654]
MLSTYSLEEENIVLYLTCRSGEGKCIYHIVVVFPQYYPNPRQAYSSLLLPWHEHDATEIQEVCDKVVEQAIVNLEEAGYQRSSVKVIGVTNQRETTVVWSRKTGKPLSRAIVWDDSRTRGVVAHYEHLLKTQGIMQLWSIGLKELTGFPLSTYFSVIKLRWMIDNWEDVRRAHEGLTTCIGNDPILLQFFGIRESVLPRLVLTSEVYGYLAYGPLKGVPLGGLVGDQQGALIGNNQMHEWYGAFLLFCTGTDICTATMDCLVAYRLGSQGKTVYALEGAIAMIKTADEINTLARSVTSTSGVYFVTAFSGLLAPYWDPGATGLLVGLTSYTTPAHIARATLEANAFQTRAVIDSIKLDSKSELAHLKVLADMGGFEVARPEMRESTALGSALLAGAAIGLFGWDLARRRRLQALIRRVACTFCRDWGGGT